MSNLSAVLESALRRTLTSGVWDDPGAEAMRLVEASGTHRLTREGGLWRVAGPLMNPLEMANSDLLCAALALGERLREELQKAQHTDVLDPNRDYAAELRRQQDMVDSIADGMIGLDANHIILSWNKAASRLFDRNSDEVRGKSLFDVLPGIASKSELDHDALLARRGGNAEREVQWRKGQWVQLRLLPVRDHRGQERGMVMVARDATRQRQQQVRLEELAWCDPLTNLPNRAFLMAELESWLEKLARVPKRRFAVVMVDLDRFKTLNDTRGHTVGDKVLTAVGKRLGELVGKGDRVARLGGDEFALLLEGVPDIEAASQVGQKIRRNFRLPLSLGDGQEHYTTVTLGIAVAEAGMEAEEVLRNSDIALYTAKLRGTDQLQVFNSALRTAVAERAEMDEALRHDVEQHLLGSAADGPGAFHVVFQPILALADDRIDGFEALLRWTWKGSVVSPARFVRSVEESGLIVPIGKWVTERSCRQLKSWQARWGEAGPRSVNVNVSVRQLRQPGFVEEVRQVLMDTGLEPKALVLEITESSFMEDEEWTRQVISDLEKLGVRLSMDDFGTGYSSFSYLSRLPFSSIKVDRSFVCRLTVGEREERLVHSIVHLALDLGMSATAEGVELEAEYLKLKAMGCPRMQGYWLSRPLVPEDATAFLVRRLGEGQKG
ncbi:MAG TPA: EAL domain-containing protein [Myxococcota bacterium]|nr:EAL domain-containing protein [Myxococcota bacterium]